MNLFFINTSYSRYYWVFYRKRKGQDMKLNKVCPTKYTATYFPNQDSSNKHMATSILNTVNLTSPMLHTTLHKVNPTKDMANYTLIRVNLTRHVATSFTGKVSHQRPMGNSMLKRLLAQMTNFAIILEVGFLYLVFYITFVICYIYFIGVG